MADQISIADASGEVWVPVPRELGPYDVSDRGRVRNRRTGRVLSQKIGHHSGGHRFVSLRGRTIGVHVLVLEAFVAPRPSERAVGRHRDNDPSNNTPDNLRWGTQQDNMRDRSRDGNWSCGRRRLSEADVVEVRELHEDGFPQHVIAERLGISRAMVSHIITGRRHHRDH